MTDVYSLGVVLYELLAGVKPYRLKRQTDAEWEEAILGADPLRPSLMVQRGGDAEGDPQPQRRLARALSGDLDNIVLKALAKRPEQRYASVEAMALDLARYRDGKPVLARPQSMGYRVRKYLHRHRWALSTASLVALVLSSALVIVAWQARQAVQEASRAQALQDFVIGLFEHAGNSSGDGPLDVRRLLDAGVDRGNRELGRQPAARAELFGVVARLRLGLGDYAPALQLLERQSLIVDALGDDAPPSLRLESVTDRGRAHLLLGGERACIGVMEPQQPLAQREQKQLPVQVSEFWSQLGRCQRAAGTPDAARPLFQRSLALRRDVLHDEAGVVENLADLASLHADAGNLAQARNGYRGALRQLRERVGARHPLSIDLLRSLCSLQRNAGDTIGAERDCGNALALARELHGDNHPATIEARRQLAAIQVDMGRYTEAEAALRESRAWLLARLGPDHDNVARDDNSLGIIAWERGDSGAALAALDRSIAIRRRHGATLELAGVLFNKAMVLHDLRRDAEARPLLAEARRLRSERLGPVDPLLGDSDRLLGEIDAALGDPQRAQAELRAAVQSTRSGYGAEHPHTRRAELSLAAFQAARGDSTALARLDVLAAMPQRDIELRKVAWLAAAVAAAQRCHGPQRLQALASLQALQAEVGNAQPEGGVTARQVAAERASCL
jgi:serine/threonine-protein kinase